MGAPTRSAALHHHLLLSQDLEPVLIGIATEGLVDVALLIRHRTDGYTQFSEDLIDVFKTEVERVDLDQLEADLYAEGALQLVPLLLEPQLILAGEDRRDPVVLGTLKLQR